MCTRKRMLWVQIELIEIGMPFYSLFHFIIIIRIINFFPFQSTISLSVVPFCNGVVLWIQTILLWAICCGSLGSCVEWKWIFSLGLKSGCIRLLRTNFFHNHLPIGNGIMAVLMWFTDNFNGSTKWYYYTHSPNERLKFKWFQSNIFFLSPVPMSILLLIDFY